MDYLEYLDTQNKEFISRVMTKYQDHEEETWIDITQRIVNAIAQRTNDANFLAELRYLIKHKILMPQGSILFGLGKPGAHKDWPSKNYVSVSLSNCVVQSCREDSMEDIMLTGARAAKCYQYRMGVGTDISILRPRGNNVHNAAKTSSGAASFMDYFSAVCGTVGQQGRRGALMLTIDISHPDIEEFISIKKIAGKVLNANVSVKVTDKFMQAVQDDNIFELKYNDKIYKTVRAKTLWQKILESAYESAEPGILFWDRILERPHGYYPGAVPITTNPCSEIPLPDDDVCLLTSIYLPAFVEQPYTEKATFNFKKFNDCINAGIKFLDIVKDIDIEMVPFPAIAKKSIDYRRIGLGTHGLADTFWRNNITYGSEQSIRFTNDIYRNLMVNSYSASIDLAKEKGPFPEWDFNDDKKCDWLMKRLPESLINDMKRYGRRNIQCNTIAPTGSVSVLSNNCSSGIEPVHALKYDRFCLGKQFKDIIHGEYLYLGKNYTTGPMTAIVTADEITPKQRVAVQAAANYWLDHSCSSTINFFQGTELENIEETYFEAWRQGCQGITVYVSGSREDIVSLQGVKKKRPLELNGTTYRFKEEKDLSHYITVNSDNRGNILEVFIANLEPQANPGIDSVLSNLLELGSKKKLTREFLEYDDTISISDKLALFTTILLRHAININEILYCFSESIAGTLPYYLKVAMISKLPESFDISCKNGSCG